MINDSLKSVNYSTENKKNTYLGATKDYNER